MSRRQTVTTEQRDDSSRVLKRTMSDARILQAVSMRQAVEESPRRRAAVDSLKMMTPVIHACCTAELSTAPGMLCIRTVSATSPKRTGQTAVKGCIIARSGALSRRIDGERSHLDLESNLALDPSPIQRDAGCWGSRAIAARVSLDISCRDTPRTRPDCGAFDMRIKRR